MKMHQSPSFLSFKLAALMLPLLLAGCGGGESGGTTPTCTVQGITLTSGATELFINETTQANATLAVNPSGCTGTNTTVTWFSSDATKATVGLDGTVTALAAGSVTITATAGGQQTTATLTIKSPPVKEVRGVPASQTFNVNGVPTKFDGILTPQNLFVIEGDGVMNRVTANGQTMSAQGVALKLNETWPLVTSGGLQKYQIPYQIDPASPLGKSGKWPEYVKELAQIFPQIYFVQRTNEKEYLDIIDGAGGDANNCMSNLGFRQGATTRIWLGQNCLDKSTVYHEVLHAIVATKHEQLNPNCSSYIQVNTENIDPRYVKQFVMQGDFVSKNCDPGSVMMYYSYAFSKNGQPTLLPKFDPLLKLGTAITLSNDDVRLVDEILPNKNPTTSEPINQINSRHITIDSISQTCLSEGMGQGRYMSPNYCFLPIGTLKTGLKFTLYNSSNKILTYDGGVTASQFYTENGVFKHDTTQLSVAPKLQMLPGRNIFEVAPSSKEGAYNLIISFWQGYGSNSPVFLSKDFQFPAHR